MTSVVTDGAVVPLRAGERARSVDLALLGCGTVGSALVRLLDRVHRSNRSVRIASALVRDPARRRDLHSPPRFITDPARVFSAPLTTVVELLGDEEPARSLVFEALERGIPVVTANKRLLARHGQALRDVAARCGTPMLYEAAVLAGVPFLGTFARRPLAARATSVTAIANGTTNFVLTQMSRAGETLPTALDDARRRGYAEPDPSRDVAGTDAAEKLSVLLQQFAGLYIHPDDIPTTSIECVSPSLVRHAAALGGVVKPVVHATWSQGVEAFAGPAFVPEDHPLARVDGVDNAVLLGSPHGRLLFQGPGAGPDVTAATVLDDVYEIAAGAGTPALESIAGSSARRPDTGWLVMLRGHRVPRGPELADYLGAFGVYIRAATPRDSRSGTDAQGYLTWPAPAAEIEHALRRLQPATELTVTCIPALGEPA